MNAPKNPKRNHHHVWQAYLKPWVIEKEIWCLQDGRKYKARTKYVAVDKDFYKLSVLNDMDMYLLDWFIKQGSERGQKTNRNLLSNVMAPYRVVQALKKPPEAVVAYIEKYSYEALENHHERIENSFAPMLERARNDDISFYQTSDCIPFLNYLCTQSTRTKGFKEKAAKRFEEINGLDFSRIWNILIHMFATNIGASIYLERRQRNLQLLKNETSVPFITSDQPVINLKSVSDREPPENLAFYYPISPSRALYLGEVDEALLDETVSENKADELNARMRQASYLQISAKEEHHL